MLNWIEIIGFAGTGLTLAAWAMKCSTHLRIAGIASSVAFLLYGLLTQTWPVVVTEAVLLPLNAFRLWELLAMQRAARSGSDKEWEWLLVHGKEVRIVSGTSVAREGEMASHLTLIRSGRVASASVSLGPGQLAGDGLPFDNARRESRTLFAETDLVVVSVDLAALEVRALEDTVLCQRLVKLTLAALRAERQARPSAVIVPLHVVGGTGRVRVS